MRSQSTPEERFWSKVDKNGPIPWHRPHLGPCWIWTASKSPQGYGQFTFSEGGRKRLWGSHRVAYVLTHGGFPTDKPYVCHHCDVPACVNPGHLYAGTASDNDQESRDKGRHFRMWYARRQRVIRDTVYSCEPPSSD